MNNRILLVDDEETIRYVLSESLISEGYEVDTAHNAFQALEHLKLVKYDLIITDIKMHGMDGIKLIRKIKERNLDLKIIIITAYGSLETVKEAAKLGVVEMISKPFKIQEIKDVIIKMLNENSVLEDTERDRTCYLRANGNSRLSESDNLLKPNGLSYFFDGPAYRPKSTVVFDSYAINNNKSTLIFGNINIQSEHQRDWWENWQIDIMIKTLFRSNKGSMPKTIINNINKFLYSNVLPHINVSMLCVHIDKQKRVIQYVNTGCNLVCTMIAPDGEVEIMKAGSNPLGISSEIDIIESTMPYSFENRLMLSRSNSMSKIIEEGNMIKRKVESALQNINGLQKKNVEEVGIDTALSNDREVSFDDETVLLISLDKSCDNNSTDSSRSKLDKMIATSIITSN